MKKDFDAVLLVLLDENFATSIHDQSGSGRTFLGFLPSQGQNQETNEEHWV